jgi:hypothetical protein
MRLEQRHTSKGQANAHIMERKAKPTCPLLKLWSVVKTIEIDSIMQ